MVMTSGAPVSLRIPDEIRGQIEDTARRTRRTFSSVALEMLEEATRMRRIPGIVFADGPAGRRARLAGTGVDVFEVVGTYRDLGEDWEKLAAWYDWLDRRQLRAALAYAEAYPEEIERRLASEEQWTPEHTAAKFPFTRPLARPVASGRKPHAS